MASRIFNQKKKLNSPYFYIMFSILNQKNKVWGVQPKKNILRETETELIRIR